MPTMSAYFASMLALAAPIAMYTTGDSGPPAWRWKAVITQENFDEILPADLPALMRAQEARGAPAPRGRLPFLQCGASARHLSGLLPSALLLPNRLLQVCRPDSLQAHRRCAQCRTCLLWREHRRDHGPVRVIPNWARRNAQQKPPLTCADRLLPSTFAFPHTASPPSRPPSARRWPTRRT